MAEFFPKLENIKNLKQKPTAGELHTLEVLKGLSDDYEIYFQPFINGHNPDIIIIRKNYGVLIIEVKDWLLNHYQIDEKDNWGLHKENILIKSPIKQVKTYKDDLYNLSISTLLPKNLKNTYYYAIVQTAVYFHYESEPSINERIKIKDSCIVYGNDSFNIENMKKHHFILQKNPSKLFNSEIYEEFQRVLKPSFHTLEQPQPIKLEGKQKQLAISKDGQLKIRGVAGSGKTLVLAQRVVNSHIRHDEKVLILTYNITLRNYIHDNLNRVKQEFNWGNFHIIHYDAFISSEANNHNINSGYDTESFERARNDINLFEHVKDKIIKYSAIFIDEIQDYEETWIRIIKKYFFKDGGEFVVFGDEKQNVYDKELDEDKKPNTTIPGRWATLDKSFRLSNNILQLAEEFQNEFFEKKYELDKAIPKQQEIDFNEEIIEYYKFNDSDTIANLSNFIIDKYKENKMQPQNICILAHTNQLLRELDKAIRNITKQRTRTTFETQEMYKFLKDENKEELKYKIRKNKRFNFCMNSSGMKLSTIHSFKGWEIDTLFLIIDNKSSYETNEVVYTALTRCKNKLFILNINNDIYHKFFSKKIQNDVRKSISYKKQENSNQKTIAKVIEEDSRSDIAYNFSKLKNGKKFNMLVLGEISGSLDKFNKSLNNYFKKHGIKANDWNIDFWSNKVIKRKSLEILIKGQSKYNLLITGQIHQHQSPGNKKGNLISELMKPKYVKRIYGCAPTKTLTFDNFINKIDRYIIGKSSQ